MRHDMISGYRRTLRSLPGLFLLLSLFLFSCESAWLDETMGSDEFTSLTVQTRASGNLRLIYPIQVLAYESASGQLMSEQTISSASEKLSLALPEGEYDLVALAGMSDYRLEDKNSYDSRILMGEKIPENALIQGQAQVVIDSKATTTEIVMGYQVACLDLTLREIPKGTSEVTITLSPIHTSIGLNGEKTGEPEKVTLTAKSTGEEGVWKVPRCYLFESEGEQTILSINLINEKGKTVYGHTIKQSLEAGIPYSISGSYQGGFSLDGELLLQDWGETVPLKFTFGEASVTEPDEEDSDENEPPTLTDIPLPGDLYKGSVVGAIISQNATEAKILLISAQMWENVASVYNESGGWAQTESIINGYSENGTNEWMIPTKDEAKLLTETTLSNTQMSKINQALQKLGGAPWISSDQEDDNKDQVRYLCNEGYHSYTIGKSGSQTKTGKSRSYFLRLVHQETIQIQ